MNKYHICIFILIIILIIILFYEKLLPSYNKLQTIEKFSKMATIKDTLFNKYRYDLTIIEKSLINHEFIRNLPDLICNILKLPSCKNKQKLYPVHIIKTIDNMYVAVFNDGQLYKTFNINDATWSGPLANSMPNRFIPLRMITTNPEGNNLIGIGYDNCVYEKKSNKSLDLEAEWTIMDFKDNKNIIYMLYDFDDKDTTGRIRKVIINHNGDILIEDNNGGFTGRVKTTKKFIKLFYDTNGYMLGLDTNFRLGTFDNKDWKNSDYSNKYPVNTNNYLIDIIYDYDNLLYGLTFDLKNQFIDIKKQTEFGYINIFRPIDKDNSNISRNLTTLDIIKSKLGTIESLGKYVETNYESMLDDDIEMAYQRQLIKDTNRLREFCKTRADYSSSDIVNIELDKQINNNADLIKKANEIINTLNL